MFNNSQISQLKEQNKQLQAKIAKLQQENTELKASLKEIIETAYQAINPAGETLSNELNPEEIAE
jgi:predicted RNase H-like nuclease (RuvC/YqgF family)